MATSKGRGAAKERAANLRLAGEAHERIGVLVMLRQARVATALGGYLLAKERRRLRCPEVAESIRNYRAGGTESCPVRARSMGERNGFNAARFATRLEQCAPDLTVARNCFGVARERVFQAGSEQAQRDGVRNQEDPLEAFACAVLTQIGQKRLNTIGDHPIGLAAAFRNPVPAGAALAAVGRVSFRFRIGQAAEPAQMLFLQALIEPQRCVAGKDKWGGGLLGAQKWGAPDGVHGLIACEIFGKCRCIAFSGRGQCEILTSGEQVGSVGNTLGVPYQK